MLATTSGRVGVTTEDVMDGDPRLLDDPCRGDAVVVVVTQERHVAGMERRVVPQHADDLQADGSTEVVGALDVRPPAHRRRRGLGAGDVPRSGDRELLGAPEMAAGERADELDDVVGESLGRAEIDPVTREPGVREAVVPGPRRSGVEVLRRVDRDHHLAVGTDDAGAQEVPPVLGEVLALVDEDGAVGASEPLVEGAAHLRHDRDGPRDAARCVELEPRHLGVLDDAGAERVEVGAGDAGGVGTDLGAALGGELAQSVGHRHVEREQEDVSSLGGEAGGAAGQREGLARPGPTTDAADPEPAGVLGDLGHLRRHRRSGVTARRLRRHDVLVELGDRLRSGRGAPEAAHGVLEPRQDLSAPHADELFALVDVDATEELLGLLGGERGEHDDRSDLGRRRASVLGHREELVEDGETHAARLEARVLGGAAPAPRVVRELETALVDATHGVGEPRPYVDRADAVAVVDGDEVGPVEADARTDVDGPAVAEAVEFAGDLHPGVVERVAELVQGVQRRPQHGGQTGGGGPVHDRLFGTTRHDLEHRAP